MIGLELLPVAVLLAGAAPTAVRVDVAAERAALFKADDGRWRCVVDVWNAGPGAPPPAN